MGRRVKLSRTHGTRRGGTAGFVAIKGEQTQGFSTFQEQSRGAYAQCVGQRELQQRHQDRWWHTGRLLRGVRAAVHVLESATGRTAHLAGYLLT